MSFRINLARAGSIALVVGCLSVPCTAGDYPIVDTAQERAYDNSMEVVYPKQGEPFFGQDAQYQGNRPSYRDNGDGTVSDLVTGLTWQQDPGPKKTLSEAIAGAETFRLAGHSDWRLPSIKELYSLILFSGTDPDPQSSGSSGQQPFIDTDHFEFTYGDASKNERIIDSQYASSTMYTSTTMRGDETVFGVNFADGRIKGYGTRSPRTRGEKTFYVIYVRGNTDYGKNQFNDNGDGTVTDRATGLTWLKADSGHLKAGQNKDGKLNWQEALSWAEGLTHAGHGDWRLPNVKELQSIVDYTRCPDKTRSAAIDPVFDVTAIRDPEGEVNYPFYWSGTTHASSRGGSAGAYVAFGRSQGWMQSFRGDYSLLDVHGAGSQRSDPKSGDPAQFPRGRGPQGDVIAIYNFVRPVRGGEATLKTAGPKVETTGRQLSGAGQGTRPGQGALQQRGMQQGPGAQQGQGTRPDAYAGFILRLDRNGDKKISATEFDGPADGFRHLDRNNDGYLTVDEAPQGPRQGPPGGDQPGPPDRRPQNQSRPGFRRGADQSTGQNPARLTSAGQDDGADVDRAGGFPNIVFVLADDLGWTGLSVVADDRVPESKSDFYQTPRLEKLAHQGMRFSNAYAPAPMCTPTRASLLTGKSPAQLHMTTPGPSGARVGNRVMVPPRHVDALPESEVTIAELLKDRGYATAHFGKWHLSGGGPGHHGFDQHDGETANGGPGEFTDPNPKDIFGVTDRAIAFIEKQVALGSPFYVQLSHYAVHGPALALETTKAALADRPPGARHRNVDYAAMTRDMDTGIGQVLDTLDSLGIAGNTYVVFMSDNGAASNPQNAENYPLAGGKASLWEGGIRVPLVVRGPHVPEGSFCRESVVGCDLFATFCELAGVQSGIPEGVEGTSLVPLLLESANPGTFRRDHEELVFHFPHYGKGPRQTPQSSIRVGDFKLIRFHETDTESLFDLARDIGEERDLSGRIPDRATELSAALDAYLARVNAQLPTANPDYTPGVEQQRPGRPMRNAPAPRRALRREIRFGP